MARVRVKPSGNQWRVVKSGRTVSNHRKKSRAVSKARQKGRSGDTLEIRRANGTIQSTQVIR